MTLQFNIPDAVAPRLVDALCALYGYQSEIPVPTGTPIPNPETRAQFARRQVSAWMRSCVAQHESHLAAEAARNSAIATAIADMDIT